MKRWLPIVLVVAIASLIGVGVLLSQFDLGAVNGPGALETRVATAAKHWLVQRRARAIEVPRVEDLSAAISAGELINATDCSFCHGYDATGPTPIGASMYPPAPGLASEAVQQYTDAELFWIVRNGIRNTPMPGFANIYGEEELWNVVRFVRSLGGAEGP